MGGESPEKNRMSPEEAHEEANVLRAQMGMSPETSKILREKKNGKRPYGEPIKWIEREATSEDYEIALRELDELERLAEEKPEIVAKLAQYAQVSIVGAVTPLAMIGSAIQETFRKITPGEETKGYRGAAREPVEFFRNFKDRIFSDARSRLERLRKKGEEFERKEVEK